MRSWEWVTQGIQSIKQGAHSVLNVLAFTECTETDQRLHIKNNGGLRTIAGLISVRFLRDQHDNCG